MPIDFFMSELNRLCCFKHALSTKVPGNCTVRQKQQEQNDQAAAGDQRTNYQFEFPVAVFVVRRERTLRKIWWRSFVHTRSIKHLSPTKRKSGGTKTVFEIRSGLIVAAAAQDWPDRMLKPPSPLRFPKALSD